MFTHVRILKKNQKEGGRSPRKYNQQMIAKIRQLRVLCEKDMLSKGKGLHKKLCPDENDVSIYSLRSRRFSNAMTSREVSKPESPTKYESCD